MYVYSGVPFRGKVRGDVLPGSGWKPPGRATEPLSLTALVPPVPGASGTLSPAPSGADPVLTPGGKRPARATGVATGPSCLGVVPEVLGSAGLGGGGGAAGPAPVSGPGSGFFHRHA